MSHALVSIRGLSVLLGGNEVLKGLDADLARERITALIGLNGAGKSTLLRALVREVPYTGEVRFHCGHDHSRPAPEHVGYVPQKLRIEANLPLTVYDLFGIALQRRRPLFFGVGRAVRQRAGGLLREVDAEHLLHRRVEKLSGGELQRVLLALALEPRPELLLLDEPAAGIDFKDVAPFYDLIVRLNERTGVTVLLVSHDMSVVAGMAHHVLCLQDGRIRCQGPPREVLTHEVLTRTFGAGHAVYAHAHHAEAFGGQRAINRERDAHRPCDHTHPGPGHPDH
jgi:zinc transport system ATP-binding protein